MDKLKIQVTRSSMPSLEEYVEEIKDLWDSRWLTNMGDKHKELESKLSHFLKSPNLVLFTNGHLALEGIIEALGLRGEVITTPFTFASTTHAIVRKGLEPVFCDINPEDYTIDVDKLESLITERTSAIIPVHVYGNICDVEKIDRIANKYNLKVIYDAAHAFGITINGKSIANFGDASMFSFHATKVFNTIEGGAVTTRSGEVKRTLSLIKNFGFNGPEEIEYFGGNAKLNEFQAAMGLCNLRNLDTDIKRRKEVVLRYMDNLSGVKGIRFKQSKGEVKSNYGYFPVVFDGFKVGRDEVFEALKKENILARKYFYPLTNDSRWSNGKYSSVSTPVAKFVSDRVLCLPLYADLSFDDVDRICNILKG